MTLPIRYVANEAIFKQVQLDNQPKEFKYRLSCAHIVVENACRQNIWRYTKWLLDKDSAPQVVSPTFFASDAYSFFTEAYQSIPLEPHSAMEMSHVTEEELAQIIWKSR